MSLRPRLREFVGRSRHPSRPILGASNTEPFVKADVGQHPAGRFAPPTRNTGTSEREDDEHRSVIVATNAGTIMTGGTRPPGTHRVHRNKDEGGPVGRYLCSPP